MFDELLALARAAASEGENGENPLDELAKLEAELGFSLRDDLAAALGGDAGCGDRRSAAAEAFLEGGRRGGRSVEARVRAQPRVRGRATAPLLEEGRASMRFGEEELGGRRFLTVTTADGTELATMSFVDGYLVAAASRALVLEAIAHRDAGTTLTASQAFRERLPSDAETDFSALFWQDLGSVSASLGQILGSAVAESDREQIEAMAQEIGPMLILAYGDADRVRLVSRGGAGPLGFVVREAAGARRRRSVGTRRLA